MILCKDQPKKPHKINVFGKLCDVPRLQQAYGKSYSFSGTTALAKPIPDYLQKILIYVNNTLNTNFNMLLVNWYRNGEDYIGMHSDDEREIKKNSSIITLSLGATRPFVLKNKKTKERIIIPLINNSILIMKGDCQKTHKHGLPKRKKIKNFRISITFREFI